MSWEACRHPGCTRCDVVGSGLMKGLKAEDRISVTLELKLKIRKPTI
jgi:hypothetical protein